MATLLPSGKQQYFDSAGDPLAGGLLYTYAAGTSTPLATYSNKAGTIPNTNPVVLDARGEATVFWGAASYKVSLHTALDAEIWTQDDVDPSALLSGYAPLASPAFTGTPTGLGPSTVTATGTTTARSLADRFADTVNVKDEGAVCNGVADDTAAVLSAITKAGQGGTVLFPGTVAVSNTLTPLARQTWIGIGDNATLYLTGSIATPAVDLVNGDVHIVGLKFRSVAGFTGVVFRFASGWNIVEIGSITNILNATGVQFYGTGGITFYNVLRGFKITSAGTALHITGGPTPNVPNNNIIDNVDVYGSVGTGLLCDGSPSQFTLRNLILEETASVCHLKVTNAAAVLDFDGLRVEGTAGSEGYYNITAGAKVTVRNSPFLAWKGTHPSTVADLVSMRSTRVLNEITDPFFVASFATLPTGWTNTAGTISSAVATTTIPTLSADGNALEITTGSATTDLRFVGSASALAAAKGKRITIWAMTQIVSGASKAAVVAASAGGATPGSQTSENTDTGGAWHVHSASYSVPSDATQVSLLLQITGTGGVVRLWSPVFQVEDSFCRASAYPSREIPWFKNGVYIGSPPGLVTGAGSGQTITLPVSGDLAGQWDGAVGELTAQAVPTVHVAGTAHTINRLNAVGATRLPQYSMVRLIFDVASMVVTDGGGAGYIDLTGTGNYTSAVGGWLLLESNGNGTWVERQRGP